MLNLSHYLPSENCGPGFSSHLIATLQIGHFSLLSCTLAMVLILFTLIILTNLDQVVIYKSTLENF